MSHKGFTLLELSIVLVIIGLIAGGILAGRDLIEAAEIRKVMSDIENYKTAVNTFKIKYNCIPGDCPNATDFWGTDDTCPFEPPRTTPATLTCNGNGNGIVGPGYSGGNDDCPNYCYENYRFWQQLGNAGLIAGSYSGTSSASNSQAMASLPGINKPTIYKSHSGVDAEFLTNSGSTCCSRIHWQHVFQISTPDDFTTGIGANGAFTPQQMLNIDTKMDDGLPNAGSVVTGIYSPVCGTLGTGVDSDTYDLSKKTPICIPDFLAGF